MCDLDCANLIDLSLGEDSMLQHLPAEPTTKTENVTPHPSSAAVMQDLQFVSPSCRKRDSLDNNPFDCVQKMVNNRQDDPFDIVEKEACFKARHTLVPPVEVKLGNLLSLSNENLLETDDPGDDQETGGGKKASNNNVDLESESPPVNMMEKIITLDSCSDTDSNPNLSSADSAASSKMKKAMEYRRRLLKLSITNSALSSPVSRRSSLEEMGDTPGTPVSSLLSRASQYGENMLASESPLKFVDDDIMSEEPPSLLLEAEKNFEADLEMLKIPMLNEINSPVSENSLLAIEENILDSLNCKDRALNAFADLEAIKAKLKAKREETNNNHHHDINSLISDLRSLINSGGSVDNVMKIQASTILETLSSALSSSHLKDTQPQDRQQQDSLCVPQLIKRQGTFDIELQEDEDVSKQPPVPEMPNCMISSTATYDGDIPEERQDLQLPEIDPPSPSSEIEEGPSEPPSSEISLQPDVNDIMEQLSKLLIHNNSGDGALSSQHNPTFIVVMNTTPMSQNNLVSTSAMVNSYLENSNADGVSADLSTCDNSRMTRRRSQSLSIHDKVKIVQLPIKPAPTATKCLQKQQSIDVGESSPVATTPPPNDLDTPEFKTPARRIRRNSYSSGTPHTAAVGLRKTGFSSDGKTTTYIRRTQTLDTHHEGQQQQQQQKAVVRPMTMPTNNMPSFKPDLKKKHKNNIESIMKSSAPLKATIPVKKVAPMIKTSPPSPGPAKGDHNTSQHKTNKIPTTPLASARSGKLSTGPGYPNACSTPSGYTSPMKRLSASATKPRYSCSSATPTYKSTTATVASAGLKRRTITEFKVQRSPLKPRLSSAGLGAAAASVVSGSTRSSASTRLSTSAGAKLPSKAPTKLMAPNTATVRPTGRFGSSRLSGADSIPTARNKENNRP